VPYIALGNELPGFASLVRYRPETGRIMNEFTEMMLRGDNTLTRGSGS
jgi:hypothetical protein